MGSSRTLLSHCLLPLGFLRTTYKSLISTVSSPAVFSVRLQRKARVAATKALRRLLVYCVVEQ